MDKALNLLVNCSINTALPMRLDGNNDDIKMANDAGCPTLLHKPSFARGLIKSDLAMKFRAD